MLTISKPLSASQARNYYTKEFASQQQNYWSRDQQGHSEWQGQLARQWNLNGPVQGEHFARLSEGQHPISEAQLVRHQVSRTYEGKNGKEVTSVEHRAGWDATFSAPKSVSITALVGGDDRVRLAHRESVRAALTELERYTQARIGNIHAPETTGKFVAATFEHDTARPVNGYAAPQLHTHAVLFNVTERDNGQTRAFQPHEIFVSQRYVTAVYRSELALRLEKLGYELERGKHGQPEIKGYAKEYLEASSPRREQIKDHLLSLIHISEHSFPAPLGPGDFVGVRGGICLVLRDGKRARFIRVGEPAGRSPCDVRDRTLPDDYGVPVDAPGLGHERAEFVLAGPLVLWLHGHGDHGAACVGSLSGFRLIRVHV